MDSFVYLNISEIYEQLPAFAQMRRYTLGKIPWQFCEIIAHCFEDLASAAYEDLEDAPLKVRPPKEILAKVDQIIRDGLSELESTTDDGLPKARDSASERTRKIEYISVVNTFDDDYTKKTVLLAYQYDTLCWLYENRAFEQAFQLSEIIGSTKCDLMRLCTIQLAEYKDQEDRKSKARQKAAKRWQPNNEIKARLLSEWDRDGDQYDSKADFCRIIAQREGLIAKTLEIWIRAHSKKNA